MTVDQFVLPKSPVYRHTRLKTFLAACAIPVFSILNRPSLRWLAEAVYDLALRWNGFAIGFNGKHGLTHPEEAFLQRFLPKLAGGVMFDVGANHGSYARYIHGLRPDLQVIAFEPHPRSYVLLTEKLDDPAITLVNMALSDSAGVVKLYDFANNDGSTQASLSQGAVALFDGDTVEHVVQCTTLDAYTEQHGIDHIAFLKVDTEGFDINVLRGARRMLSERRIGAIQFEFIPANIVTRVTMRDFYEMLPGYDLFRLCTGGDLMPMDRYDVKRCEIYVIHNVIALPKA
jgi:FkbM family methyltransferase